MATESIDQVVTTEAVDSDRVIRNVFGGVAFGMAAPLMISTLRKRNADLFNGNFYDEMNLKGSIFGSLLSVGLIFANIGEIRDSSYVDLCVYTGLLSNSFSFLLEKYLPMNYSSE